MSETWRERCEVWLWGPRPDPTVCVKCRAPLGACEVPALADPVVARVGRQCEKCHEAEQRVA